MAYISSASQGILTKLAAVFTKGTTNLQTEGMPELSNVVSTVSKQDIFMKILSSLLGLTASIAVSYLGIRYIAKVLDPTYKEKQEAQKRAQKLLNQLGIVNVKLTDYELCVAANLVDPVSMSVSWEDIGGLQDMMEDLQETVLLPFKRSDLFAESSLITAPKGVLLYGPPGCGKTMIAKATAKAAGARFINLQVSTLVDKWYGESQKRVEAVFSLAIKLQPTIIFIDEIDSFLRSRSGTDHESTVMMKTQFMSLWDGLMTDAACRVLVIGASNRPQDVDAAILRRMPTHFHIRLPNRIQREAILRLILKKENIVSAVNFASLAEICDGLSGSDLHEMCRLASMQRIREFIRNGGLNDGSATENIGLRPINMADLEFAVVKLKETINVTMTPTLD